MILWEHLFLVQSAGVGARTALGTFPFGRDGLLPGGGGGLLPGGGGGGSACVLDGGAASEEAHCCCLRNNLIGDTLWLDSNISL